MPDLAQKGGVIKATKQQNTYMMNHHATSPVHNEVLGRVVEKNQIELDAFMERRTDIAQKAHHTTTARHFRHHSNCMLYTIHRQNGFK